MKQKCSVLVQHRSNTTFGMSTLDEARELAQFNAFCIVCFLNYTTSLSSTCLTFSYFWGGLQTNAASAMTPSIDSNSQVTSPNVSDYLS